MTRGATTQGGGQGAVAAATATKVTTTTTALNSPGVMTRFTRGGGGQHAAKLYELVYIESYKKLIRISIH